jgi:hypothetical protein
VISKTKISNEKIIELYNKGYLIKDIEEANELANIFGKPIEEILEMKGKATQDNKNSWDKISDKLMKDTKTNKIPDDIIKQYKNKDFTSEQVANAYCIAQNHSEDIEKILEQMKQGKTNDDINSEYLKKSIKKTHDEKNYKEKITDLNKKASLTEDLQKALNLTDDEISKYVKEGLTPAQIGYAKKLAQKYGKSLDQVMKIKNNRKDWPYVIEELRGENK